MTYSNEILHFPQRLEIYCGFLCAHIISTSLIIITIVVKLVRRICALATCREILQAMLAASTSCANTVQWTVAPDHNVEDTPVQPVRQSSTRVLDHRLLSIPSLPLTCLRLHLSIVSLVGTPLGFDTKLLLMSEASSVGPYL